MAENKRLTILEELFAFEHTTFDISLVYIGMLFAASISSLTLYKIILITVAFFAARAAAMIMNRYAGRENDLLDANKRRRASMGISKDILLDCFCIFAAVLVLSSYLLNLLAFSLTPILLAWFIIDPMLKPHTEHRHYNIGMMMGFGIFAGYIGALGRLPLALPLWLLFIAVILIGGGSDIIYTVSHMDFDRNHGLKTYASKHGAETALRYSLYSHILAALFLVLFGIASRSVIILIGTILASGVLLLEHRKTNYDKKTFRVYGIAHYKGYVGLILLASTVAAFIPL